jgi:hypothetical protein
MRSPPTRELFQVLIHTGQHYDSKSSDVFLSQLGIPDRDVNLSVGSGTDCRNHDPAGASSGRGQAGPHPGIWRRKFHSRRFPRVMRRARTEVLDEIRFVRPEGAQLDHGVQRQRQL